jgi:hypothetical protein
MEKIRPIIQENQTKKANRYALYIALFIIGFIVGGGIMYLENRAYTYNHDLYYQKVIIDLCEINNLHDEFILTVLPDLPYQTNYTTTNLNCSEFLV